VNSNTRIGRRVALAAGVVAAALVLPLGAAATTGIETTVPVKVVLTDKGAVWTPALNKLRADTDTTFEIKVVNKATQPHSFRIGYRETKVLPKGSSQFVYFAFHLIGKTPWQVKHGNVQGAGQSGKIDVKMRKSFSGANELDD
jgi:hypothetical protein